MSIKKQSTQKGSKALKGQSLIEIALLLPILLVLIIGAIEFGRLFYSKTVITNAAREGAYFLVTHKSDLNTSTGIAPNTLLAVQAEAFNSGIPDVTVQITPKNCCTIGFYSVEVTVETKVQNLLVLGFLGNAFSISATNHAEYPLSATVEMMVQ